MKSELFSINEKNYINNAVVIADSFSKMFDIFDQVSDYKIKFKKPFLSHAEFKISTSELDGTVVGNFKVGDSRLYFSYVPINTTAEVKYVSSEDIQQDLSIFNLFYKVTDMCRGQIENKFTEVYGQMSDKDKVIFALFECPVPEFIKEIIQSKVIPSITFNEVKYLGNRRFSIDVNLNGKFLGTRYSSVKEFNL